MKHFFASWLVVLGLLPAALHAQTVPPMPAAPPANLQGVALRDWYRANWYDGKRTVLSYDVARGRMYNYIDNVNNTVTCVYSGYSESVPFNATSTNPGVVNDINCEHSIPQSWFNEVVRMRSDIHHLFPTREQWNSDRGSDPFADIPDASTLGWLRNTTRLTTIPTSNIDEYSEDTNSQFEPREDHKGNLARAAFYFYTMHANEAFDAGKGVITALADLPTLYRWHLADPVDAREIERNNRVAASQGNFNPYIAYPSTVATAWGFAPPGPVFSFATATGAVAEGNAGTTTYTVTVNLTPAATAPATVQVGLDANSTATSGTDFAFASPTTLTFPAGTTSQTVSVTVTGDAQPELDETVVLALANAGAGTSVGNPGAHTLTLTNDDGQPLTVNFASAGGTLVEGNAGTSTYTVNVVLSGGPVPPSMTVPITLDAANSTATASTDYILNTTSVSFFSGGPLTQPVTITVNGDATFEPNETVRLLLGTPAPVPVIIGQPSGHVFTILNDDAAPAGAPCTKPYFSQYVESGTGSGNTKVLEIYNPTLAPMPLAGKRVVLYNAGSTTPNATLNLTGTIAPGDVYVIGNTGLTDAPTLAQTDILSNVAFFSGAQSIALFDATDTLDVIGVIGQTPNGGGWAVANGSTLNNTLVRLPATSQGGRWNGPYGSATWTAAGLDNYAGVGSYTSAACFIPTATRTANVLRNALEIYPNPAAETVQLRLPGTAAARTAGVTLLDMMGRTVRQRTGQISATEGVALDLRNLPAGIYAVRVSCAAVEYTGRVVVVK